MKFKIHTLSAALTFGLFWSITLFLWTLVAAQNGYGRSMLDMIATIYPYYEISLMGAFWGLLWGFLDAFIGTYIIVWLYNKFVDKLGKK